MFRNQQKLLWLVVVLLLLLSLSACAMPTLNTLAEAKHNADFSKHLMAAITQHNYTQLQQMMGDKFMWVNWGGQGTELPSAVALVKVRANYFTQRSPIAFDTNKDLTTLLGAQHPLSAWRANVKAAEAIYATGLGDSGKDEAILIIAQKADGTPYWYGMLAASGGFAHQPAKNAQTTLLPPKSTAPVTNTALLALSASTPLTPAREDAQRIQFAAGATSYDLHSHLAANSSNQYLLSAKAGQVMQVAIVAPGKHVFLAILGTADGVTYKASADQAATWRSVLPINQDYLLKVVTSGGATDYNLHVVVR